MFPVLRSSLTSTQTPWYTCSQSCMQGGNWQRLHLNYGRPCRASSWQHPSTLCTSKNSASGKLSFWHCVLICPVFVCWPLRPLAPCSCWTVGHIGQNILQCKLVTCVEQGSSTQSGCHWKRRHWHRYKTVMSVFASSADWQNWYCYALEFVPWDSMLFNWRCSLSWLKLLLDTYTEWWSSILAEWWFAVT